MIRLTPLLVCLLLIGVIRTQAQADPTPTHTPTFAIAQSGASEQAFVDGFFPQAIRFEWSIQQPANTLSRVTLTITPVNRSPITITLLPAEARFVEPSAVFVHFWELPIDPPLPLFSLIEYRWTAYDRDDGEIAAFSSTFQYEDTRTSWQMAESGGLSIAAPADLRPGAASMVAQLSSTAEVLMRFGNSPPPFGWVIYLDPLTPACEERDGLAQPVAITPRLRDLADCRPNIASDLLRDYTIVQAARAADVLPTLHRQLITAAYRQRWTNVSVPAWFAEALVNFYLPNSKADLYAVGINAARAASTLTLVEMMRLPAAADSDIWAAQAYGMILYTAEQIGFDGLAALANSLDRHPDFAAAYETATGMSLNALIPAWESWLQTDRAVSVYGLTPYQASTTTPTVTRTPSPTATPTATMTLTFTPTATPTGILSPTPFTTATLTPSLSPAPATNTPRPAGSLPTPTTPPTPIPVGNPPSAANSGAQLGVLVILSLMLIVLIVLFLRSGGTRR